MTRTDPPFHLRLPAKLKAKLAREAKAKPGKISLNSYLLALIQTHQDRSAQKI